MTIRLQTLIAAAESGDAEAMTDLALVHARGEERQRVDLRAALAWYERPRRREVAVRWAISPISI